MNHFKCGNKPTLMGRALIWNAQRARVMTAATRDENILIMSGLDKESGGGLLG